MRAILIDPFTRSVSDIDTDAGLDDLYNILQVDLITVVRVGGSHAMILDDEGLLKEKESQEYFTLKGSGQPFAGRGLILADEYGESRPATLSLDEVRSKVEFIDKETFDPDEYTGWTVTFF